MHDETARAHAGPEDARRAATSGPAMQTGEDSPGSIVGHAHVLKTTSISAAVITVPTAPTRRARDEVESGGGLGGEGGVLEVPGGEGPLRLVPGGEGPPLPPPLSLRATQSDVSGGEQQARETCLVVSSKRGRRVGPRVRVAVVGGKETGARKVDVRAGRRGQGTLTFHQQRAGALHGGSRLLRALLAGPCSSGAPTASPHSMALSCAA